MDDKDQPEAGKKRRRRGSLIERAGSMYDFEAVLRSRVQLPDDNPPLGPMLDVPPAPDYGREPPAPGRSRRWRQRRSWFVQPRPDISGPG